MNSNPICKRILSEPARPLGGGYTILGASGPEVETATYKVESVPAGSANCWIGVDSFPASSPRWDIIGPSGPMECKRRTSAMHTFEREIAECVRSAVPGSLAAFMSQFELTANDGASGGYGWPQGFFTDPITGRVLEQEPPYSFSRYDSLTRIDFSVLPNASGRNLVRLLGARARLDAFELMVKSILTTFADLNVFRYFKKGDGGSELTTDEALEFFDSKDQTAHVLFGNEVLDYVLRCEKFERILKVLVGWRENARDLRDRISIKILSLKRKLCCVVGRFCGLSWTRRFWLLLHGSHPPKPGRWQFDSQLFGCVGALAS